MRKLEKNINHQEFLVAAAIWYSYEPREALARSLPAWRVLWVVLVDGDVQSHVLAQPDDRSDRVLELGGKPEVGHARSVGRIVVGDQPPIPILGTLPLGDQNRMLPRDVRVVDLDVTVGICADGPGRNLAVGGQLAGTDDAVVEGHLLASDGRNVEGPSSSCLHVFSPAEMVVHPLHVFMHSQTHHSIKNAFCQVILNKKEASISQILAQYTSEEANKPRRWLTQGNKNHVEVTLRDFWYRGRESNPHGISARGF